MARNGPIFGGSFSLKVGGEGRGTNGQQFPPSSPGLPASLKLRRALELAAPPKPLAEAGPGDPVRRGPSAQALPSLEYWMPRSRRGMTAECVSGFSNSSFNAPAARSRPSCCRNRPRKSKRAQGMPGEGLTHGPRAVKKHGEGTTGSAKSSGIPCAMVLRLIRALPGAPGFLATVTCDARASRKLGISVGMPGPHDFAVRNDISRPRQRMRLTSSRPPHPRLTCRDDRPKRPS
jgi:hypothetical protein